ncbi:MAG: hypothetical protein ACI9O4_000791, partial [Chitinophagales bacterium]
EPCALILNVYGLLFHYSKVVKYFLQSALGEKKSRRLVFS